jgi:hypothetical protein
VGKYVSAMTVDGTLEPRISVTKTSLRQTMLGDVDDMMPSNILCDDILEGSRKYGCDSINTMLEY